MKIGLRLLIATFVVFSQIMIAVIGNTQVYAAPGDANDPILISTPQEFDQIRNDLTKHYKLVNDIDLSGYENWIPIGTTENAFSGLLDGNGYTVRNIVITSSAGSLIGLFAKITGEVNHVNLENVSVQIDPASKGKNVGALAGEIIGARINNVHIVSGTVSGGSDDTANKLYSATGGFAGVISGSGQVTNSSASVHVKGFTAIGGFAGNIEGGSSVNDSYADGNVSVHDYWANYSANVENDNAIISGGFAGRLNGGILIRVYAKGKVLHSLNRSGGLIGQVVNFAGNSSVQDAYAIGDVTAKTNHTTFSSSLIGGLIGQNYGSNSIQRTYATGSPAGVSSVGGLIGALDTGQITNSFFNKDIYVSSAGGTGKNTLEMQSMDTFTAAGWDFTNTWIIEPNQYPVLRLAQQLKLNDNTIDNNKIHLNLEGTYSIAKVEALFPNNAWYDVTSNAQYSSGNETIATVGIDGKITAHAAGTAEIYVQYPGRTEIVHVVVNELVNAATPTIGTQPQGATVKEGDPSPTLSVAASVSDGGTLTYQWYSSTTNSNSGGTLIDGATNQTYAAPTSTAGTTYYYVVVTNTNNSVNGTKTATTTSDIVAVTVNIAPTYTIFAITNQTLTALTQGYASGTQETKTINVTNTGTGNLMNLAATLSGTNADDFELTQPLVMTLNSGAPATTFTVKAKNGLAAGTYTATVTVSADHMTDVTFTVTQVVNLPGVPANPQNLVAIREDRQVTLNWSTVTGATYYNLYMSTTSGQFINPPVATVTDATYEVQNLSNGTTYYFVVKAGNPGGLSAESNQASATPATVPAAPTNISAVAGYRQATVSFTAPTDNGGDAITDYVVTASPGNITAIGTTSPITVTGLTNGTSYTFTVKAINGVGPGASSAESNAVIPRSPSGYFYLAVHRLNWMTRSSERRNM